MRDHAIAVWGRWRPSCTLDELDVSGHRIIEEAGTAIGCLALRVEQTEMTLARLFVDPGHRGRGVGGHVLQRIAEEADRRALPLRLSVLRPNPAFRLYLRHGFELEHETMERLHLLRLPRS
ncbi:GNAT family N-acetyltransferase [Jannaschia marina]|uniref:GNAT family N-acetyltransferase n=1 Tax=Jannaschia marina TaxID=2741674 RepID=UPI0015CC8B93|nr:GNAT family N-acetyltransferase [Jannaschia marina]